MSNAPESHHEKSGIRVKVNLAFASLESAGFSLSVDTTIPSTGITAIFGGSGSGKTSLLRFIAGLERPPLGQVSMDEAVWQNDREFVPTYQRPIGYVFQESSLFSHLNAEQNLNFALKRAPEKVEPQFIGRVISIMGISELLKRRPHQLSGGERQRVAIARALLIRPKLLLMDEPLASLDERLKQEILPYLETLKTEFELPILYVSHSMTEVSRLADHALMLDRGKVVAQGKLTDVFSRIDQPIFNTDKAGVVLQGVVVEKDEQWKLTKIRCSGGELWVAGTEEPLQKMVRVRVRARDVSLALASHDDVSILNRVQAEIVDITEDKDSPVSLVRLRFGNEYLVARITRKSCAQLELSNGKMVWAQIKSAALLR